MQRDTGETRLLEDIPCDVLGDVFADWLDVKSLTRLDSAVCSYAARPLILKFFASDHCIRGKYEFHTFGYIIAFVEWFTQRKIKLLRIQIDESSHALSKYLRLFSKSIRYVCCKDKDAIDLVAVHCRNLESFSCLCTVLKPNLHAVLASNENLRELRLEYARELYATHFEDLCLPQLALLSFNATYCTDPVFATLVHTTGKLQHVQIKGCYDITDAGVIVLAQHCPLLRTVGLARLKISGAAIEQLIRLCPNIETLDLESNNVLTDAGVLTIATNLKKLRNIDLSCCKELTEVSLEHLAQLQTLYFVETPAVQLQILLRFLQNCSQLRTLYLDCDINAYYAVIIPHMWRLEIFLTYSFLSDDCLCMIAQHCKQLRTLQICFIFQMNDANKTGSDIGGEDLAINDVKYTDKGLLAVLDGLPHLRRLVASMVSGESGYERAVAFEKVRTLCQDYRPDLVYKHACEVFLDFDVLEYM